MVKASARRSTPENTPPAGTPLTPRLQQGMRIIFLLMLLTSAFFLLTEHWRRGVFTLGMAMLWLASMQYVCSEKILGVLRVRSARADAIFSGACGALLAYLALSVDSLGS